jgi:hypothetical protein
VPVTRSATPISSAVIGASACCIDYSTAAARLGLMEARRIAATGSGVFAPVEIGVPRASSSALMRLR